MTRLSVHGLGRVHDDGRVALSDLSFDVRAGSVTGFLGPNGAGKTTAMRLMTALDRGSGTATFDGRPYEELGCPARHVGVVLGPTGFHPRRSARHHLRLVCIGAGLDEARVDDVLGASGLRDVADVPSGTLSLGMRQRLAIATALLGEPDVLLLDEPMAGLDPHGVRWLRQLLARRAADGAAVLVSSHRLDEVEAMCDRVVVISEGRLVADVTLTAFVAELCSESITVRTDDPLELAEALRSPTVQVERVADRLVVRGSSLRQVAEVARARDHLVYELRTDDGAADAYLQLVDGLATEVAA